MPATGEFSLYSRTAFYVTGKAQRILGYQPTFTMAKGIALSVAWLRHEGYYATKVHIFPAIYGIGALN